MHDNDSSSYFMGPSKVGSGSNSPPLFDSSGPDWLRCPPL